MNNNDEIMEDLTKGKLKSPINNKILDIPIKNIKLLPSTDGLEVNFIKKYHFDEKILIISDDTTWDVLGSRVFKNLSKKININNFIWKNPASSIEGVNYLRDISKDYSVLIAIGSGTINDSVKYATYLDKKKYSVFPTSPMNAYTSPTASVSFKGIKKSIYTHSPIGVYFDLSILSKAPKRLIKSAFSDVLCRTTSQFDWILSNRILNSKYNETPYYLLNLYENELIKSAKDVINNDMDSINLLTKVSAIMGLSTFFTGSTHYGSMSEHGISHFIDNFSKNNHPGTSHGEQVGIATLTISKIQNSLLKFKDPPEIFPTKIPENLIKKIFGNETLKLVKKEMKNKNFSLKKTKEINNYLNSNWDQIVKDLKKITIKYEDLWKTMGEYKAIRTIEEANLNKEFYNNAIKYSRFMRDRYTILDFIDDSKILENYIIL